MAFVVAATISARMIPSCSSRNSSQRRPARAKTSRPAAKLKHDPILNDGDVDTTDITTFVSCPACYNSIMLRPQQLSKGSMRIMCNCCGKPSVATMSRLENMDGTRFDYETWKASDGL